VFFLAGFGTGDVSWLDRLIGGAAGYLAVRIISDGYYYITGREGLGLGDGKLLAVIGVVLGWRALPVVVFSASFIGVLVSVPILLVQRRRQGQADPLPESPPAGLMGNP
jgi:leader peptidase (prepilin peptidase)/N-methyltransferase